MPTMALSPAQQGFPGPLALLAHGHRTGDFNPLRYAMAHRQNLVGQQRGGGEGATREDAQEMGDSIWGKGR
jgi:hypothetical protein